MIYDDPPPQKRNVSKTKAPVQTLFKPYENNDRDKIDDGLAQYQSYETTKSLQFRRSDTNRKLDSTKINDTQESYFNKDFSSTKLNNADTEMGILTRDKKDRKLHKKHKKKKKNKGDHSDIENQ